MVFDEEEERGRGGREGRRERYRKAARRFPRLIESERASASGTNVRMGFNGPRHLTMVE